MIWVPDAELLGLIKAENRIDFNSILNTRKFTVKDSSLTYRQANSMSEDNMLPEDKDRGQGWRKFSLKELVYIELVLELKKLGLKHSQLKNIWDSFFKKCIDIKERDLHKYCCTVSDEMLSYVFGHIEIILTITEDGDITWLHPVYFTMFYPKDKPFVFVSMSNCMNKVMKKVGRPEFTPKATLNSMYRVLTDKEKKVLTILRNNDYKSIQLTLKNGEVNVVHAERKKNDSKITIADLVKRIDESDYQRVSITKRDGEIVSISQEDTIKV